MKPYIGFTLLLYTANLIGPSNDLSQYDKIFAGELKPWTSTIKNFKLSDFRKAESFGFEEGQTRDFNTLQSYYAIYKPILSFSQDGSQFVDIYSSKLNLQKRGDVYIASPYIDQSIYLCNTRTKYWKRVNFQTNSKWIDDVAWISNTKFILVGITKTNTNEKMPFIVVGDTEKKTLDTYISNNRSCVQDTPGYTSPKLKKIKIQGM